VNKLAEQVAQLPQHVAALAGGRPVWNARRLKAEMSAADEYGHERPVNARSALVAGYQERWQVKDDDAPPERGGLSLEA
jgi:hypothetical protein